MKQNEVSLGRFLRIVLLGMALTIAYFVLDSLSAVLLPFAIAWLLAYLLQPLVSFVQNKMRLRFRMLSIVVTLVFICLVVYGMLMLVLPSMISEMFALKDVTMAFLSQNLTNSTIPEPVIELFKGVAERNGLASFLSSGVGAELNQVALDKLQMLVFGTVDVVQEVFTVGIILLYLFFILLDFERLSDSWKLYIPKRWRGVAGKLWGDLVNGMNQYFRGQALVAFCVGVLFSLGFIIIDFPVAIAFGMFIGMLNLVPYLQALSLIPMALLSMLKAANTGGDFWLIFLSALAVLAVVQAIQDLFLVPRIMGRRMNLHPAVILLSLSIWGHLLGLLGMIVALPLTTLILGYLKRYHEVSDEYKDDEESIFREAIDTTTFAGNNIASDAGKVNTETDEATE